MARSKASATHSRAMGSQGLTRMSMEHLLTVATTAAGKQKQQLHDLEKLMEAVSHAKDAIRSCPPSACDDNLAIKKLVLDTDSACYHFQTLDAVSLSAAQQAKPFCLQLATVLQKHREEMREFVAGLIALLCRTIHNQEVFSDLLLKANRDVAIANRRAAAIEADAHSATAHIADAQREAAKRIAELEKALEDHQEEATRLELEASRPAWQWKDAAADPTSLVPSQAWYDAEMAYFKNQMSMLEARNGMLLSQKQDDLERAQKAERLVAELEIKNAKLLQYLPSMQDEKIFSDSFSQTDADLNIYVHTIMPNLIARGGSAPSLPYLFKFVPRANKLHKTYDLELPENFKIVYENFDHEDGGQDGAKSKKGKIKKIGRLSVASLQRKHNPLRMIIFATVSPNSYVTLSLRNTTKWIDELWTRRIITAYDAGFQNLSMEVMQDCADEFEIFVWEHFVKKYGSKHEASIHVGDFVVSLRKHRDSSHRVRIFSEYVGVDMRRPKIAFSLHIIVMHSIFKFLRPDEDNGAVWCPLYNAEQAALALTKDKDIAPSALSTFFSNTLPEIATVDPIAAKGGKVLHVVDADLFSEALTNLIMSADPSGLEHVVDVMCERAEHEALISLPRFLSLMSVLNATLDAEMLESEFEKIMAENNNDVEAITYDQFLIFVRQHPLDGSPDENDTLRKKEAPTFEVLKVAIDKYWYMQAKRMRRTLADLKSKQERMSCIFEKFDDSLRFLDRELDNGRIEILPELWVYARMMMTEALAIRVEEPIQRISKPRTSFFRASTRKLHIMKALLPRSSHY